MERIGPYRAPENVNPYDFVRWYHRSPSMRTPGDEEFESIDWDAIDDHASHLPRAPLLAFLVGATAVVAALLYDSLGPGLPVVRNLSVLDWLLALSVVAATAFGVVPLARRPARTREYWRRLRARPLGLVSVCYVALFVVVGLLGPVFVEEPARFAVSRGYQPPLGTSVATRWLPAECLGPVRGGRCHGTLQYPLGTTRLGGDMLAYLLLGARTALLVAAVSAALIAPTGVAVGLLAASVGGTTDRVLMRIAEVLQTVPAIILYILLWDFTIDHRLLLLILVFGATGWGGLARDVRNETRRLRERLYVSAAESAGAERPQILRWHLLPNVSRTVLTNVSLQVPLLILTEAAISFIVLPAELAPGPVTLGDPTINSWGQAAYIGIRDAGLFPGWWITAVPSLALLVTTVMFLLFGRTVGDVLDPRTG